LEIPEQTQSLVLIVADQDAPNHWIHWLVFNIPPTTQKVKAHEIPEGGIEGLANNNTFGYEGPCPRYFKGTHHYTFTLYALDALLPLPKTSDAAAITQAMAGHVLEKAELVGIQTGG
jgi:Raf kinase inhibitor-like YbhB/YbcL family protein